MPNTSRETTTADPKDGLSTWDEFRRLADQVELEIHLASMEARERWRAFEPRLEAFEHRMKDAGERATKALADELASLWDTLRGIQHDTSTGD